MIFTTERLRVLSGLNQHDFADGVAAALENMAPRFGVTTPLRRAHLAAQLCFESAGFTALEENLNYTAERIASVWPRLAERAYLLAHKPEALANAAYAGRLGNGAEETGDGWRYRGRGLIHLTGRANYRVTGAAIGVSLESDPDLGAEPEIAAETALAFWQGANCNAWADVDDVVHVTRAINGPAMEGLDRRRILTARAKTIFT